MSRDVAVDGEVVVALGVLWWSVAEGALTLCRGKHGQQTLRIKAGSSLIILSCVTPACCVASSRAALNDRYCDCGIGHNFSGKGNLCI